MPSVGCLCLQTILDQEHEKQFADNSLVNDERRLSEALKQNEKPLYTAESLHRISGNPERKYSSYLTRTLSLKQWP